MKKIAFTIIEFEDVKKFFVLIFDKVKFYFSKPKYKIGDKINMEEWGKNLKIISIVRNWEYNHYIYSTTKSDVDFSEGLIDFYNKGEIK